LELLVGIDLGTTGVKVVAFDTAGREVAGFAALNPVVAGPDGSRSVDADELVAVVCRLLSDLEASVGSCRIAGIGISTAMFSILPVDEQGHTLAPSRTWADGTLSRAEWSSGIDFYNLTGCRMHPIYPHFKIRYSLEERSELRLQSVRWVSLAEYVFKSLTGTWAVSRSIAASSGLLNIHTLDWCGEVLKWCGIGEDNLSPLVDETFSAPIAYGPLAGVPLAIGATDGTLCHLGTDSMKPGQMTSTIGTSGAIRLLSPRPIIDEQKRTWCYYLTGGNWVVGGAVNCGAIVIQWLSESVFQREPSAPLGLLIHEALNTIPPGSDGLIFVPEIMGERAPGWDETLRGAIYGLSLQHNRLHIVRAALEGITLRMYLLFRIAREFAAGNEHGEIRLRATGGYTRSPDWLRMQADMFGLPIELPSVSESAAFGAACLAAESAQVCLARDLAGKVTISECYTPHSDTSAVYNRAAAESDRLWSAIRQTFGAENNDG